MTSRDRMSHHRAAKESRQTPTQRVLGAKSMSAMGATSTPTSRRSVFGMLNTQDAPTPDKPSPIGAPTYVSDKAAALVSPKRPKHESSSSSPEGTLRRSQSIAPHMKHQLTPKELAHMDLAESGDKDIKRLGTFTRVAGSSPGRRTKSGRLIADENNPLAVHSSSNNGRKVSGEVIIPGITHGAEELTGTHGRIRLALEPTTEISNDPIDLALLRNPRYMDSQRQNLHTYEYLCHVGEAKEWLERTLDEKLPTSIPQLENHLRDGITLARIAQKFNPDAVTKIFRHPVLQYKHIDNISQFLNWIRNKDLVGIEECYQFETTDLYNKRNIPGVIYCIHALSHLLANRGQAPKMNNLVGKLDFTTKEVDEAQRQLDAAGIVLPNFDSIQSASESPRKDAKRLQLPESPPKAPLEPPSVDFSTSAIDVTATDIIPRARSAYFERDRSYASNIDVEARQHEVDKILAEVKRNRTRRSQKFEEDRSLLDKEREEIRKNEAERARLLRLEEDRLRLQSKWQESQHEKQRHELEESQRIQAQQRSAERQRLEEERRKVAEERAEFERRKSALDEQERRLRLEKMREQEEINGLKRRQAEELEIEKTRLRLEQERERHARQLEAEKKAIEEARQVHLHTLEVQNSIAQLQALFRGAMARKFAASQKSKYSKEINSAALVRLQAAARRGLARRPLHQKLLSLMPAMDVIEEVQSWARYFLERKRISDQQEAFQNCRESIVTLQARVRGGLQRNELFAAMYNTANLEPVAIRMQAVFRGVLVRRRMATREAHWRDNVQTIVKLQTLMRAKIDKLQYDQLTRATCVPLNAVKKFLHLLSDSDLDFHEEIELEERRRAVVSLVRELHALEADRSELDMKIALFVKHKITADDMSKTRRNHALRLAGIGGDGGDIFSGHDKHSRDKRELYGQLFYLCQTRPQYLARLFAVIDELPEEMRTEKDTKVIEAITMALFGYAQKAREEYYLLALLGRCITEELQLIQKIQASLNGDFMFLKLANQYFKDVQYRDCLEGIISPRVNDILRNVDLDLEISPSEIYKSIWQAEYRKSGKRPARPETLADREAVRMPDTRTIYIQHLQQLRAHTQRFLDTICQSTQHIPYGLRFLARRFFDTLSTKFTRDSASQLYVIKRTTCAFVYLRFFQPSLAQPETLQEVDVEALEQRGRRRNMVQICTLLQQIMMGSEPDDECLHPLHEWIQSATQIAVQWIERLIDIAPINDYFHADEYADLASSSRPIVYISPPEIYRLHSLLLTHRAIICQSEHADGQDVLWDLLRELGGVENPEPQEVDLGARKREVALVLSTQAIPVEDYEAEYRTELAELKRYAIAVLKVQSGRNLVEIMVQEVTVEDEHVWQHVLTVEELNAEKSRKISEAVLSQFADLKDALFADVKIAFFELLLGFEERGIFTRTNGYQDFVNVLAVDIRNKHRKRSQRSAELDQMSQRMLDLKKKREYLESQIKSYHTYIDNALIGTQKNRKKKLTLPFTVQFFHERHLARQGKVPRFGSYKYTAAKLFERDILISMDPYHKSNFAEVTITVSSDEVGQFTLEAFYKEGLVPRGTEKYGIQDLLEMQYDGKTTLSMFGCQAKMNLANLLLLISKKFYV